MDITTGVAIGTAIVTLLQELRDLYRKARGIFSVLHIKNISKC